MDIDIDVSDNETARNILNCVRASIVENDELKSHIVGTYFQNIPIDKITGLAAIPYNVAEDFGYHKIDLLNLSLLKIFSNKQQIKELLKYDPDWELLTRKEIVEHLFHVSKHYDTLKLLKPKSVDDLADVLAIIRPNKKHLIDKYIKDKDSTRKELYTKLEASDLRKSHAIPYALLIVLQLHLIKFGKNNV